MFGFFSTFKVSPNQKVATLWCLSHESGGWGGGVCPTALGWINHGIFIGCLGCFTMLEKSERERRRHIEREREVVGWERVGTDLFLLNSSRLNQQIIDLIK